MTERDYIKVTNKQVLRDMRALSDDLLGSESPKEYGVSQEDVGNLRKLIYSMLTKCHTTFGKLRESK